MIHLWVGLILIRLNACEECFRTKCPYDFVGAKGGVYPAQALWNGIREGEGKGLRRTGVRRAAAAAPGPGRGGRVPPHGMGGAEPHAREFAKNAKSVIFTKKREMVGNHQKSPKFIKIT